MNKTHQIKIVKSGAKTNKKPFYRDIEKLTIDNNYYRHVLYTLPNFQLVLMSLKPGVEIGMEAHPTITQFIRVESGNGVAIIDNVKYPLSDGFAVVIPPKSNHNIINTSTKSLKLYSIYTPHEHKPGTLQLNRPKNG